MNLLPATLAALALAAASATQAAPTVFSAAGANAAAI